MCPCGAVRGSGLRHGHEGPFQGLTVYVALFTLTAMTHARGDDAEAGTVQGRAGGSKLSENLRAVATLVNHANETADLALNAYESVASFLELFLWNFHDQPFRGYRLTIPPGV